MKKLTVYRSSETGKFVDKEFAKLNPKTTQKETVWVDEKEVEKVMTEISEAIKNDENPKGL